jgi:hypothetical protein
LGVPGELIHELPPDVVLESEIGNILAQGAAAIANASATPIVDGGTSPSMKDLYGQKGELTDARS